MTPTAEFASRNGDEPKIDATHYRTAVKATMKKWSGSPGQRDRVDPSEGEVDQFLLEAAMRDLDPLAGQIYAVWEDGVMKVVVSIDGLRLLAERTGNYAGQDDPEWCDEEGRWSDFWAGAAHPAAARVRVHRKGAKVPTPGTANWTDFAPSDAEDDGSLWKAGQGKPAHMLSIRAEALALRKAFPAKLSGLYTLEELGISIADSESAPSAGVETSNSAPLAAPIPPDREPSVLVDPPTGQPSGPPASPESRRTLAEALRSGEYDKLRNELTGALFAQLPDRLTDGQTEQLVAVLREADEAGITAVELERICKVTIRESSDPETRRNVIFRWIAVRHRTKGAKESVTAPPVAGGSEAAAAAQSSPQPEAPESGGEGKSVPTGPRPDSTS